MSDPKNPYQAPASTDAPTGSATGKTREALGKGAPWIRFLGIVGYISCALLLVAGVAIAIFGSTVGSAFGAAGGMIGPVLGLVYVAFAIILFFPTLTLNRLAKKSKQYKLQGDPADLEGVAVNVKSLAQFWGILTIVILALYVVILAGVIIAAIVGLSR